MWHRAASIETLVDTLGAIAWALGQERDWRVTAELHKRATQLYNAEFF